MREVNLEYAMTLRKEVSTTSASTSASGGQLFGTSNTSSSLQEDVGRALKVRV